jgi:MFS family permease
MNDRSRWTALVVLCTGMLMIVLDMTIVNVALPSIQADLGFTQAGLAWVVNAYLIAFAGLLLLAGRLGDLAGRRNVFLTGLAVFTVASLVCTCGRSRATTRCRSAWRSCRSRWSWARCRSGTPTGW